jgi:hypothetical protein
VIHVLRGLQVHVFEEKSMVGGACRTEYPFRKVPGLGHSTGEARQWGVDSVQQQTGAAATPAQCISSSTATRSGPILQGIQVRQVPTTGLLLPHGNTPPHHALLMLLPLSLLLLS